MSLEILTPSYARDFELCRELVASVARFAPAGTRHTVVVPPGDAHLFSRLESEHVRVLSTKTFLPRSFLKMPVLNLWVNVRAPWMPVRGWIAQQLVKLEAVARSSADAVLVVDSDIEFIRPFSLETFAPTGSVPLYRIDGAVTADLPRHMMWDDVAHRLIGAPRSSAAARPDYICWPCVWEPRLVRQALSRLEEIGRGDWATIVGRQRHFSEMVLYGVFVDASTVGDGQVRVTSDTHCRTFTEEVALDRGALDEFFARVGASDVAVMISAKSGTDVQLRRQAIASIRGT